MPSSNNVGIESQWSEQERSLLKLALEDSMLLFARYFFRINDGSQFIVNNHHELICDTLERVLNGEIKRLIINLPPGYTKCCCVDTIIHTTRGLKKIQHISAGDYILSYDKTQKTIVPRKVVATEIGRKECNRLVTHQGTLLDVSNDHPILTKRGWVTAANLLPMDNLMSTPCKGENTYEQLQLNHSIGVKKVYHLQIDAENYDNQNFIANNIVVHNTELAVIYFIARGLALNPRSRFIHASYSENLTMLNSAKIKDIIQSPEYNELWPMELRADSQSKKAWVNTVGGGLYAPSAGGQITGFRAGRSDGEHNKSFSGAFILDDPIKIEAAFSDPMTNLINGRFTGTYASRLQHQDVPVILIMQRIKDNDPAGFLLKGGSGDKWHHLNLPLIIPEQKEPYPKEWTHGIEIPYKLPPGLLWEYKHNSEDVEILKHDEYTYNAQYMQRPSPVGGGLFKENYWGYYTTIPKMKVVVLFADTATKKGQANDYSVFLAAGLTYDNKVAVLDVHRAKYETPELMIAARAFWNKHKRKHGSNRAGATTFKIEDKSSGTFLIQQFRREGIPVQDIQRNIDKIQRALSALPEFSKGNVLLPEKSTELTDAGWVLDFKNEHSKFTANDTHDHDDQIDTMLDAVETLLIQNLFSIYDNLRQ